MQIEKVPIGSISFDPANARKHPEKNLAAIEGSLRRFGQRKPIVVRNGVVIAGNGTLAAAKKLGWKEIDIVRADDMSATDAAGFAIADNRTSELAEWDSAVLAEALAALQLDGVNVAEIGFDAEEVAALVENGDGEPPESTYTDLVKSPIYQPTGEKPAVSDLLDREKATGLIAKIDAAANVEPSVKEFLRAAAYRHFCFNYQKIAEFYAHANPETKSLFEQSALVIIDFKKAIEGGFVKLTNDVLALSSQNLEEFGDE